MSDPKPMLVLWSKAAVKAAGADLPVLQAELVAEVTDIVSKAQSWFIHALAGKQEGNCFRCTGREHTEGWDVFVQTASYVPLPPAADDHPDPAWRGKALTFPEIVQEPGNEAFSPYGHIAN